MGYNFPDTWGVRNKYTKKEKKQISHLQGYRLSHGDIEEISERVMKKVYKHGDTSDSTREFVEDHPEYSSLSSWKEKKKMLKKRFPYLTSKELDYLGKISGDFE